MIYKLVCAGDNCFDELYKKDDQEIIIAIDGGYKPLIENNIKIDYFFGDYDSLNHKNVICENKFEYSSIKDLSDFDLALDYLINELKINKEDLVYVYNATGGRLDHYYAILNSLKNYKEYSVYLIDKNNKIYYKSDSFKIKKNSYKYISFFSVNDETIISIKGCKYNIDNYNLKIQDNLCLSNEIIDECVVDTNKSILVIESNE